MPLRHPLCVVLDYLGYRLVCMALLPISPATLQYGTRSLNINNGSRSSSHVVMSRNIQAHRTAVITCSDVTMASSVRRLRPPTRSVSSVIAPASVPLASFEDDPSSVRTLVVCACCRDERGMVSTYRYMAFGSGGSTRDARSQSTSTTTTTTHSSASTQSLSLLSSAASNGTSIAKQFSTDAYEFVTETNTTVPITSISTTSTTTTTTDGGATSTLDPYESNLQPHTGSAMTPLLPSTSTASTTTTTTNRMLDDGTAEIVFPGDVECHVGRDGRWAIGDAR
jgi:hypothetical protein